MSEQGRNELCKCGSLKKFKKCCLLSQVAKDIEEDKKWSEWFEKDLIKGVQNVKDSEKDVNKVEKVENVGDCS